MISVTGNRKTSYELGRDMTVDHVWCIARLNLTCVESVALLTASAQDPVVCVFQQEKHVDCTLRLGVTNPEAETSDVFVVRQLDDPHRAEISAVMPRVLGVWQTAAVLRVARITSQELSDVNGLMRPLVLPFTCA